MHEALRRRARVRLGKGSATQRRRRRLAVGEDDGSGWPRGRGYDPGKRVKGRKRHLLVDTQGLVKKAKVHSAGVFDRDGIKPLMGLTGDFFPRLSHLWLDAGYNGKAKAKIG